jgi:hypothetical protein
MAASAQDHESDDELPPIGRDADEPRERVFLFARRKPVRPGTH